MPEWLSQAASEQLSPELPVLALRLLLAWGFGCLVAWLARRNSPAGTNDTLTLTLVLMSILIAMATQIIGDNVARAFSLVGALSIVRFRTAVPETRDVAFVLAAVVVGMAVGAGQYWVAAIGIVVVGLATQLNSPKTMTPDNGGNPEMDPKAWKLTIETGLNAGREWEYELQRLANQIKLTSTETIRRGSALQMVYCVVPKAEVSLSEIVSKLNAFPMVESVAAKAE